MLTGDLLQKTETSGLFASEDAVTDQERMDRGELVATGPMFGSKMRAPVDGSAAAELEQLVLSENDISVSAFGGLGKLALGTRRPIAVPLGDCKVEVLDQAVAVAFDLPKGAFATCVLAELLKPS